MRKDVLVYNENDRCRKRGGRASIYRRVGSFESIFVGKLSGNTVYSGIFVLPAGIRDGFSNDFLFEICYKLLLYLRE